MLVRLLLRKKYTADDSSPSLRLVHLLLLSRRLRTFFLGPDCSKTSSLRKEEDGMEQLSEEISRQNFVNGSPEVIQLQAGNAISLPPFDLQSCSQSR